MEHSNEKEQEDRPAELPSFLSSVVTPLDKRVEMASLPKMCSCWSFGR